MAQRRYQSGHLFVRGKRRKNWIARWWENVIRPDGTLGRVQRSEVLGPVSELSKREARKLLEARLRPLNQGRCRPQSIVTFERFVQDKWLPVVGPTQHPGSARTYASKLRCHVLPAFRHKPLNQISRHVVQLFLAEKQARYSGAHVHGMRAVLSKILAAAVEWGFIEENPARGSRVRNRAPVRPRHILNPTQVQSLAVSLPEPCRTLVLLAVLTGLRIGELLALRWERIDLPRGAIAVRETFSEGRFGPPKTKSSERSVPLSATARRILEAHRTRCAQTEPNDLVFATRRQTPLNPKNLLRRVLRPTCDRLGLPPVTWHGFRHTHATLLSEVGVAPRVAQEILGHSDVGMTLNVYTHVLPEAQRDAVEKVGDVLFPNVPNSAATGQNAERLVH